jgi:hypothetical protein
LLLLLKLSLYLFSATLFITLSYSYLNVTRLLAVARLLAVLLYFLFYYLLYYLLSLTNVIPLRPLFVPRLLYLLPI